MSDLALNESVRVKPREDGEPDEFAGRIGLVVGRRGDLYEVMFGGAPGRETIAAFARADLERSRLVQRWEPDE